ncbi:MAG: restriction endonuclease [Armatimonadetes bacterium]|nr:restriction endonuclease [Armatimonadota bacterium]
MIPTYAQLRLPMLELLSDRHEHTLNSLYEPLASRYQLTDEERNARVRDGRRRLFENRVQWAKRSLIEDGLVESTGWGRLRATPAGIASLADGPEQGWIEPARANDRRGGRQARPTQAPDASTLDVPSLTPEEHIEQGYRKSRAALADELLERVKSAPPAFFEQLVVDLLVGMGYGGSHEGAARAVGGTGDGGVDGMIDGDPLGLDLVYVQAKRWAGSVGLDVVRAFVGALTRKGAHKGVLVTTSTFTAHARKEADGGSPRVVLIDGALLAQLMIEHNVGVVVDVPYVLKRVDTGYFESV